MSYVQNSGNTAARIQSKCIFFNCELIVSDIIHDNLSENQWPWKELGELRLKGKLKPVVAYAILN